MILFDPILKREGVMMTTASMSLLKTEVIIVVTMTALRLIMKQLFVKKSFLSLF